MDYWPLLAATVAMVLTVVACRMLLPKPRDDQARINGIDAVIEQEAALRDARRAVNEGLQLEWAQGMAEAEAEADQQHQQAAQELANKMTEEEGRAARAEEVLAALDNPDNLLAFADRELLEELEILNETRRELLVRLNAMNCRLLQATRGDEAPRAC
ncbi:hypothetical protein Rsub_08862 [Raphidocelis subcapitata]|uniref:Uncharacterized protein n=1 Tax=Raphidocelis subcapitata TaxID=307507 RepID=A0A2V0PFR7_9CHLO|nr:hypothetical protein Rsub_08862 [Raphidocelis subcapitata]|eukprot:GBF96047.1 hypothetical protein Rsub_08862 [Raphidocelis subcapitata]